MEFQQRIKRLFQFIRDRLKDAFFSNDWPTKVNFLAAVYSILQLKNNIFNESLRQNSEMIKSEHHPSARLKSQIHSVNSTNLLCELSFVALARDKS